MAQGNGGFDVLLASAFGVVTATGVDVVIHASSECLKEKKIEYYAITGYPCGIDISKPTSGLLGFSSTRAV
jgi:hypothetical protein